MKQKKRKPVKPVVNDKVYNLHHPEYHGKIEKAFVADGIQYYCFTSESGMRYGRYIFLQDFLQEMNLRMTIDQLRRDTVAMKEHLNMSKGKIDIGKVLEILSIHEQQCNLAFEPETVFRLASCIYFDETEILSTWDKKHNEQKIARWKESHTIDFFFHKLFQELTGLKSLSKPVLASYLQEIPDLIKGWRLMADILSR